MLGALLLAGIFFAVGALVSGKFLESPLDTWKSVSVTAVVFIAWTYLLHVTHSGSTPDTATTQVALGSASLFFGLRSSYFVPDKEEPEE